MEVEALYAVGPVGGWLGLVISRAALCCSIYESSVILVRLGKEIRGRNCFVVNIGY